MSPCMCVLDGHIVCQRGNPRVTEGIAKINVSYSYTDLILSITAI